MGPPSLPEPEAKDSKTETVEATSSTKPSAVPASETPKVDDNSVMVQVPSYDDQVLIDQTASYVCRNGGEKLGILRKRMPEKFAFLRSDNKYNTYYQFKVALYHEMRAESNREQKGKVAAITRPIKTISTSQRIFFGDFFIFQCIIYSKIKRTK